MLMVTSFRLSVIRCIGARLESHWSTPKASTWRLHGMISFSLQYSWFQRGGCDSGSQHKKEVRGRHPGNIWKTCMRFGALYCICCIKKIITFLFLFCSFSFFLLFSDGGRAPSPPCCATDDPATLIRPGNPGLGLQHNRRYRERFFNLQ